MLKRISKKKILILLYIAIIFIGTIKGFSSESIETFSMPVSKKNILIDAGHGGWDPGKVRSDGTKEKNINLEISEKLKMYLEQGGAYVMTTRSTDDALSEKKREDLKQRREMANNGNVDILISIHQNSFPKGSVKGAQVFYYKKSEQSKKLAESIQRRIKEFADPGNERIAKSNSEYYILKQTKIPAVIVECGFLSNDEENAKLNSEKYQERIAWAIYMGIIDFCKETNDEKI